MTDGFVLYTSAVLGQSLIVLPSIAARHAGPWSILVWAGLAVVSYPLARIMAELGARYPSAGGVIAFIGQAWGSESAGSREHSISPRLRWAGQPTALIFSEYLGQLVPLLRRPGTSPSRRRCWPRSSSGNCFDVSQIMRLQRWGFFGCLAAITGALLLALPHVTEARLTDVSGYDLAGVASTGLICFFAFVGWENAAFSGEEFADPRTLVKALGLAVAAVGILFVLLGITVVGGLEPGGDRDERRLAGRPGAPLAGRCWLRVSRRSSRWSLLILFMFTWARSATRLIYALAREGLLPHPLTQWTPRRAHHDAPRWRSAAAGRLALAIQILAHPHRDVHPALQRRTSC